MRKKGDWEILIYICPSRNEEHKRDNDLALR